MRRPRPRPPSLAPLQDPAVLAALERALAEWTEDGDGCRDPRACDHAVNRAHPAEFLWWLRLRLDPPPTLAEMEPLSQDRRARWARKHKAEMRERQLAAAS